MNMENSKTNQRHRLYLRSSNKNVAFQNLSIYYAWKNTRKQCKKNNKKLKIIAPTWDDEFEFLVGSYSVSDIENYI